VTAVAIGLVVALFGLSDFWLLLVTKAVLFGIIFLSITVITGMAGQISLCQATFAAVGGFTVAQFVDRWDVPVLLTVLAGTVLAAIVGALLAMPVLRLGGIYLALATLAFAMMFDSVFVPLDWVSGGVFPLRVHRPELLVGDRAFFLFSVAVLAGVGTLVILVRRGTTGRFLDALRGSETAATAIGINATRARVIAFALSAGIAGLGGGVLTMFDGQANYAGNFTPFFGLFWLVIVVTLGVRTVEGAVQAGLALVLFPELLKILDIPSEYQFILFGLGAFAFAKHPEGLLEYFKRMQLEAIQRRIDRRKRRGRAPDAPAGGTGVPGMPAPAAAAADRAGR
jgi:ABC-type branched-subunit amino acid transport system permease subunit